MVAARKTKPKRKRDRYDMAMEELLCISDEGEFQSAVAQAWGLPSRYPGGALFEYVQPIYEGGPGPRAYDGESCGCLTQVKAGVHAAYTEKLTEQIRADYRIPHSWRYVTRKNLYVFAVWQRRIDKILGRVYPVAA